MESFGRFQLHDLLGQGAVGEVFFATMQSEVNVTKPCIIKRLKKSVKNKSIIVSRFTDEMQLLSRLDHPNIVNAFEFGEIQGQKYVAMELIDGCNLRDLLQHYFDQSSPIPSHFSVVILIQVAKGLQFLHDPAANGHLSIIHRDLAPHNILISKNGAVKIADFGLAKSDLNVAESTDGSIKGHLRYMSPEQAQGKAVSTSTDIFSLGILAYELLSAKRLYNMENMTMTEALITVRDFDQNALESLAWNSVPKAFRKIVRHCLAPNSEERLPDLNDFIATLAETISPQTIETIEPQFRQFIRKTVGEFNTNLPHSFQDAKKVETHKPKVDETLTLDRVKNIDEEPASKIEEGFQADSIQAGSREISDPEVNDQEPSYKTGNPFHLEKQKIPPHSFSFPLPIVSWATIRKLVLFSPIIFILVVVGLEEGFIPEKPLNQVGAAFTSLFKRISGQRNSESDFPVGPSVHVETNPDGAKVMINGEHRARYTPYDLTDLESGETYQLELMKPGYQTYRETFELKPDESRIIVVTLKKAKNTL